MQEEKYTFERFESLYPSRSWENEIRKLIGFIWSGNSAQIIGFTGVGRSNLLGILSYNRACRQLHLGKEHNNIHFVLMNFSEMKKKNENEILKFFFISIIDSLKERLMEDDAKKIHELLKESMDIPDQMVILQGLKKAVDYLSLEKNLHLVFLIDRFEDYVPYITPEFFTDLRALRNRAKYKFSVVFSVNRPLEDMLEPSTYVDFYEFLEGNQIYLPLKDEASLNFRIKYLELNSKGKISEEIISKILNLTAGHGKLTRLAIESCLENEAKEDLAKFLLSENKINKLFLEIWKNLTPSEQKYLITLEEKLKSDYLEKVHLINNGKAAIPLFGEFITARQSELKSEINQKITYDPGLNEIRYGDVVLSNSLTSSEFKLLKFMIENNGKVLERDEVIRVVWAEQNSTEGVSEQALDQLVFRLRKKIEENPNSPSHLETVKGRGFKFTA